jgi:hypothetical protein
MCSIGGRRWAMVPKWVLFWGLGNPQPPVYLEVKVVDDITKGVD